MTVVLVWELMERCLPLVQQTVDEIVQRKPRIDMLSMGVPLDANDYLSCADLPHQVGLRFHPGTQGSALLTFSRSPIPFLTIRPQHPSARIVDVHLRDPILNSGSLFCPRNRGIWTLCDKGRFGSSTDAFLNNGLRGNVWVVGNVTFFRDTAYNSQWALSLNSEGKQA